VVNRRRILSAVFVFLALFTTAEAAGRLVAVTQTGKKYHVEDCRTLARSKGVKMIPIEQAKARGLEPCKVCEPGE